MPVKYWNWKANIFQSNVSLGSISMQTVTSPPRSILIEPRETGRHHTELLRKGGNKPEHVLLWPPRTALPCHAMPCREMPGYARQPDCHLYPLWPSAYASLVLLLFFFSFLHLILHPSFSLSCPFSLSVSPPSIWWDSSRTGPWSPSAHSHLIKGSHSTVDNVTDGC